MSNKSIFEDLIYLNVVDPNKHAFCLTYDNLKSLVYAHTDGRNLYSTYDYDTQKNVFAILINIFQQINDVPLINFLDGLHIFHPNTNLTSTTTILRAFRNGTINSQDFIVNQNPALDPLNGRQGIANIAQNGYDPTQLLQWSIVFYDKPSGIFQFNSFTDFMNKMRHVLTLIYNYFKLGL